MRWWHVVLGLVGGALALAACGTSNDSSGSGGHDAGSGGGSSWGKSPCFFCVAGACQTEEGACNADPACAAWLECMQACPSAADGNIDPACASACALPTPAAGKKAAQTYELCRLAGSGAACATCGADAGPSGNPVLNQKCGTSTIADSCEKCMQEKCCDTLSQLSSGSGAALVDCWLACATQDLACQMACYDKYPDAVGAFSSHDACVSVRCIAAGDCKASGACTTCEYTECGQEYADCEIIPDCYLALQCIGGCSDPGCASACLDAHPTGKLRADILGTCMAVKCQDPCSQ